MPHALEYHSCVRQLSSPAVTFLTIAAAFLFLTVDSVAQVSAPPSSVTSPGFGGRPANGTSPSVTSVGPRGYAPHGSGPSRPSADNGHQRRQRTGDYAGPYWYAYPVPYEVDPNAYADTPQPENDEGDYQGGPTVFDRRGSGARSYIPPVEDVQPPHSADQSSDEPVSAPAPSPSTMLVFKDGHKLEVGNYAIVGSTLFDLTPGHSRRVPLSDLDLDGTKKENEDRGVTFDIPTNVGS